MRRRDFITLIGGAVTWPLPARAQRPANVYRIAVVRPSGPVINPPYLALVEELRRLGYVEGQNLIVERYSGEGRQEHYTELAREVVSTKPHLLFVVSSGLVLDTVTRGRREMKLLAYLSQAPTGRG